VVLTSHMAIHALKETERRENALAVRGFEAASAASGCLCGACDAFLHQVAA
jgi:hypothetical protein